MNPSTRIPTVDDLRVKLCFICREEERFDNPQEPRRAWVHPCNCTLVAHESCLLQWIKAAQQDPARARNALKCPQCGATYELESDNPFILRLLDHVNASLSVAGKVVSAAGLAGIIVSFGFGIYIICTSYGAYAIQEFLGKEMYNILLTDDPSNWPWHAYMDLPLIPFSLIFSRTRFFDSLPFVPLLLAWPSSAPVASTTGVIAARWAPAVRAPPAPSHVIFTWPPSPIVVTMLFPILTAFYRRAYSRIKHQIMGTQPGMRPALREVVWDFGGDGPVPLRARIGVNVEPADQRRPQGGEQAQGEEEPDDPGHVAERTLRVTNASLGRFIGGALMMPAIANYMGAILYRLSKHFQLLRRFLAVRPPLQGPAPPPVDAWVDSQTLSKMGYLKQIGLGMRTALDLICGGTRSWQECDPVWWRNSIGLGIFLVAKDCVKLMHLYLAKRELETRRIKSRSFAGVDMRELDLVQRPDTPSK